MPYKQVTLDVPLEIFNKWEKGEFIIKGLAKDSVSNQIKKHLDVVKKVDKDEMKTTEIIIFGVEVALLVAAGSWYIIRKIREKRTEEFKKDLITYINAIQDNSITIEIIDNLIKSIDKLKEKDIEKINLSFNIKELDMLVSALVNHGKALAEANNVEYNQKEENNFIYSLKNNLIFERDLCSAYAA